MPRRYQRLCPVPSGMVVDHADGDRANDDQANLRPATYQQNACNRRALSATGFKGVTQPAARQHSRKSFLARIMSFGQSHHLGWHETAEEAAIAYDLAAMRLHRQFARLNFVEVGCAANAA